MGSRQYAAICSYRHQQVMDDRQQAAQETEMRESAARRASNSKLAMTIWMTKTTFLYHKNRKVDTLRP